MSLDNEWLNFSEDNMEEFEDENDKPHNTFNLEFPNVC